MTEHNLSTRDIAARSETETTDESRQTDERDPSDEPLARDQATDEPQTETRSDDSTPRSDQEPLLPSDETTRFSTRWREIQASFVDEPRDAVAQADALVADLMQRLAASFSNERESLEGQWDRGDDVSTEDLRVALTRYRSFFERLLSA